ncbi:MAG: CoA transferase [Chloroflexota bacterium]|nr:MAG: CoA transferase [Chloroflexota bacterium]
MAALKDIRIVDITRAMAGPYCTMMLGDFGADIIKVERPGSGDESRGWGPPFVGDARGPYPGQSAYFLSANRNKRSLTVNLKNPQGQDIIRALVRVSDVLIENYRTGVLDKMGLGVEELRAENPRLIYCSISGYGRTGPDKERPGYDAIIQAEGGMMGITGPIGGPPSRVGVPIIDITSGMFAASAILAALLERAESGQGQHVDVSLLDTQAALLANVASNYLISGEPPRRQGNAHPNIAPYEPFQARDKGFVLGAANQRQWEKLCELLGALELKTDPRFESNQMRVEHRQELIQALNEIFAGKDAADWLALLEEAGLPCGPINTVPEVFQHPQTQARGMVQEVDHPSAGRISLTGFPYKLSRTPAELRMAPPCLGEHNRQILVDLLGYSDQEVDSLQEQGVI